MARVQRSLDGEWEFWVDPQQRLNPRTLDLGGDPRQIRVPGPWQAQFEDLRDYSGVAWYRCEFEAPSADEFEHGLPPDPTFVLCFGAVDYHTSVWLNGQHIGDHEGGYLPFEFALDEAIQQEGDNELIVRVIDPGSDIRQFPDFPFAEIPHGKQSWYGPIGGIWQSVRVEVRHTTHLVRLQITPDVAGEAAETRLFLNQPAPEALALRLSLTDPQGQVTQHSVLVPAGATELEVRLSVPNPLLWHTTSPNLYHLQATLHDGAVEQDEALAQQRNGDERSAGGPDLGLDSIGSNFGMRTIGASEDGHLMLNGRILFLRGALDQDYYPELIYTPFSDAALDDQFAKAKHMGLNCLRTHIKITDPRYYDAADRAGILIWTELPNWESLTEGAKRRARETLTGMVERDWNHPSIIIWTIINESWGVDLSFNPEHRAWLAETYTYLKELDPHRLAVGNSACYSNFHVVTDIEDFHNYYAIPDHYHAWRDWVRSFASRPAWTFARAYESHGAWHEFLRDPWNPRDHELAPEVQRRGNEPMVVSEFGNWGLPDVEKLRECYGGEPWWFETGMEWGGGVVYPHGIEQRYRHFHLDKVFPTLSELTAATQRMQYTALKYEIEQMRRYQSIVGYIITEFTDLHWECNGLLDICRNPKAFYDVIGFVNSADAIVPDWERVVFWEGERCEVNLALSHFSGIDLAGSRVEWYLDLDPKINGQFEGLSPKQGTVIPVGTISFEVPTLAIGSMRARLEFRLVDAGGTLVTRNHQELYLFPRTLGTAPRLRLWAPTLADHLLPLGYELTYNLGEADVAVVETMTDEMRWYLHRGGRVIWLAERPGTETHLGTLGIEARHGRPWQGDWASNFNWIRQDQMFSNIPTGGTVDFAFADLTPDHVIVGLNPRDFAADVHSGLFVGWLHHTVALIAERRIDLGRLLVSTFRLSGNLRSNPVARIMFNDMLNYLAPHRAAAPQPVVVPGTLDLT
jgi:hypothetical protein